MPIDPALPTGVADQDPGHTDAHNALHAFLNVEAETEGGAQAKADAAESDAAAYTDSRVTKVVIDALGIDAATLEGLTAAQIQAAVTAAIIDSSPATLDTLNELAAALGDDPDFATTITNSIAAKASQADLDVEEAARIAADQAANEALSELDAEKQAFSAQVIYPSMTAAQIQAVMDDLSAAGGGTVIAASGDYEINASLLLPWRVHLIGAGWSAYSQSTGFGGGLGDPFNDTIFTLANGVDDAILKSKQDKALSGSYFQQNSVISGITFKGNRDNNTFPADRGLVWFSDCQGVSIRGCTAEESDLHGFAFRRTIASSIVDCGAFTNNGAGIYLYSDADDNRIEGNQVGTNSLTGITAVGGSFLRIIGNKVFNNGGVAGIFIDGNAVDSSHQCSLVANDVDDNSSEGIYLSDGKRHTVTANVCTRNGNAGIRLGGVTEPTTKCLIVGNVSGNTPGGTKQDYGIQIDASCDDNRIVGNDFSNNNTAARLQSATATSANKWRNNIGVIDTSVLDFPRTADPANGVAYAVLNAANRRYYYRSSGSGLISKIGIHVGTQAGNITVDVYRNSGSGRSAIPGAWAAGSGSVACPAGWAEVALTAPVYVEDGDWLSIVSDTTTATFRAPASVSEIGSDMGKGAHAFEAAAFTAPATAGTLTWATGRLITLIGVA